MSKATMRSRKHIEKLLYRRSEVAYILSISQDVISQWVNEGLFPKPVLLGKRRVGWRRADVEEWAQSRQEVERGGSNACCKR